MAFIGGEKATATGLDKSREAVVSALAEEEDQLQRAAANCLGGLALHCSAAAVTDMVIDITSNPSPSSLQGYVLGAGWILHFGGDKSIEVRDDIFGLFRTAQEDDRAAVRVSLCR